MSLRASILYLLFTVLAFGQNDTVFYKQSNRIMEQAISQVSINNSEHSLQSFSYKRYTKAIFKTQEVLTQELLSDDSNFLFEEVSLHHFDQKNKHTQTVLSSNIPGFEQPYYPLFVRPFYAASIYEKEYTIFDKRFHGPLAKNAFKNYKYELIQTDTQSNHPYYIIQFSPLNDDSETLLEGQLFIDVATFAVQKAIVHHKKNIEATIIHQFEFKEKEGIWFPQKTSMSVSLLNSLEPFYLFGKRIPSGKLPANNNENQVSYFEINSYITETGFNTTEDWIKKRVQVNARETQNTKDNTFWNEYRLHPLTDEEHQIYKESETVVIDKGIERRIQRIEDFGLGFLELGFFDLDLKFLIKYNNYEGFRSGLGGVTNEKLSSFFSVGGYLVRGFKDEAFKYQVSTDFELSRRTNTILGFTFTDDIAEIGSHLYLTDRRTFSLFEPRLVNISEFYQYQTWKANLRHQIIPEIDTELQFSKSDIAQTVNYQFLNDGKAFSNYTLSEIKTSIYWSPFGNFMETPLGVTEYKTGYPRFSTQFTQSVKGFLNGDFNYTKIDFRTDYLLEHINQSFTEIILEGNMAFGDLPLTHSYHAYPNSPNKETVMKRFSVAGIRSFETMYFGEFFSDKLATFQIKHQLKPIQLSSRFQPEIVLISRHAIGTFSNEENHESIGFNTLEKGYSESGIELNKLLFGFGASFAYRYGAYHLPQTQDNISFKFTFNLKL
ncbi:hypothetical protein GCM10011312_03630 [Planktosalinus lacus]|uniref:Uncharacterized protein n=2 Tax=Planktosalinus lacus TaxID=1526573 RepID=A0A8J2Y6M4_9FLAO|nr:hypothetical protein GCM10011312_03630 [Planktosalinus lacus]